MHELLMGTRSISYSGKSQHNFTRIKMGNFQRGLLKCLNMSWNHPEMLAKALFDSEKAKKRGLASESSSKLIQIWWILGQQVRISPKMAPNIIIPSFLPYYFRNSLPKYSSMS